MKVQILRPALEDLVSGREFYNQQQEGVGDYFFDSLYSEIDSLVRGSRTRIRGGFSATRLPEQILAQFSAFNR